MIEATTYKPSNLHLMTTDQLCEYISKNNTILKDKIKQDNDVYTNVHMYFLQVYKLLLYIRYQNCGSG
jgi:hypothetical protein